MVRKFRDHGAVARVLDEFPHLKLQGKRGVSRRRRTKPAKLAQEQQAVVDFVETHKQTISEVARCWKCKPQAVHQLYQRARQDPAYKQRSANLRQAKPLHANTQGKGYCFADE